MARRGLAAAAGAAAAGAGLAVWGWPGGGGGGGGGGDPFADAELEAGLRRRRAAEAGAREALRELRGAAAGERRAALPALERALFEGSSGAERRRYVARFGCAAWTPQALAAVAAQGPLLECGAGAGRWADALAEAHEADVLAFDVCLPPACVPPGGEAGVSPRVRRGDGPAEAARHPERALLLVYPTAALAERSLESYRGETVVYVGEGEGGANGSPAFFAALRRDFAPAGPALRLAPFPGGHEKLWVLKRRPRGGEGPPAPA